MRKVDLLVLQQPAYFARKAATWGLGRPLHEQDDFGLVHESTQALIELLGRLRFRRLSDRRGLLGLGKRRRGSPGWAYILRDSGSEGGSVCTRDALEKGVALRPGGGGQGSAWGREGGTHPQEGRRIAVGSRRTRSRRKEGTLSISNDSDISDCSSASI